MKRQLKPNRCWSGDCWKFVYDIQKSLTFVKAGFKIYVGHQLFDTLQHAIFFRTAGLFIPELHEVIIFSNAHAQTNYVITCIKRILPVVDNPIVVQAKKVRIHGTRWWNRRIHGLKKRRNLALPGNYSCSTWARSCEHAARSNWMTQRLRCEINMVFLPGVSCALDKQRLRHSYWVPTQLWIQFPDYFWSFTTPNFFEWHTQVKYRHYNS